MIIDEIHRRLQTEDPMAMVLDQLELVRKRERLSLHGLSNWLQQEDLVRRQIKRKGK